METNNLCLCCGKSLKEGESDYHSSCAKRLFGRPKAPVLPYSMDNISELAFEVIKSKDYVYIIEIKTDSTPDEALAQIEEKGYARPFADDRRRIFRVGVNFSTANRRIDGWKVV